MICVGAAYRPPTTQRSFWKKELYQLLDCALSLCDELVLLGDLNCDRLQPDKHSKEGINLLDLCDIFDLKCLVKESTRITTTSCTLIDVILTNS